MELQNKQHFSGDPFAYTSLLMEPSLGVCFQFHSSHPQEKMVEELDPFSNEADTDIMP